MKVVLLHGFPLDERMWEPQLESLRDYEVSTPRLYGRGESLDDWAASLLDEQDVARPSEFAPWRLSALGPKVTRPNGARAVPTPSP